MTENFYSKPEYIAKKESEISTPWDFSYYITERELNEWETNTCSELKHSVTIIELGDGRRIDSDTIFFALRQSCETLRRCARSTMCTQCDKHHAELFKGLVRKDMVDALAENIARHRPKPFYAPSYRPPRIKHSGNGRVFIEYRCPLLGYRELVFPVTMEQYVIGVLFVGQFRLSPKDEKDEATHKDEYESEKRIESIREEFLKKNLTIFEEYLSKTPDVTREDILAVLLPPKDVPKPLFFPNTLGEPVGIVNELRNEALSWTEYQERIHDICTKLEDFEYTLKTSLEKRRRKYVIDGMSRLEQNFYASFPPLSKIDPKLLKEIKYSFKKFLVGMMDKFSIPCIAVFAEDVLPGGKKNGLPLYAAVSRGKERAKAYKGKSFQMHTLAEPPQKPYAPKSSLKTPGLFDGFPDGLVHENKVLLVYPSWVVVFELDSRPDSYENELYKDLLKDVQPFFTNLFMAISTLHANFLREKFELTLHMYKHECTHIAKDMLNRNENVLRRLMPPPQQEKTRLAHIRESLLSETSSLEVKTARWDEFTLKTIDGSQDIQKRLEDACDDMSADISLISNIAAIIGTIVGTLNKENEREEEISVFKTLLYKWDKAFYLRQREKNLAIIVPQVRMDDWIRPYSIRTDRQLLEVVLYNILDNAVKYCHWGSNIYADFQRVFEDSGVCELVITDFGLEIELDDEPYEVYYRQKQHVENDIHGDGLGLFAVKQICAMLNMNVRHTCTKVSDYNIPLIQEYVTRDFFLNKKDPELVKALEAERLRLKDPKLVKILKTERFHLHGESLWDIIVNSDRKQSVSDVDLSESDLLRNIRTPTHEVCFTVEMTIH